MRNDLRPGTKRRGPRRRASLGDKQLRASVMRPQRQVSRLGRTIRQGVAIAALHQLVATAREVGNLGGVSR
jgi:hypothetical protein